MHNRQFQLYNALNLLAISANFFINIAK